MKTFVTLAIIFCMGAVLLAEQPDADRARAQQIFQNFDTNADGGITLEEYRAGMAGNMSETRVAKVFKEKDRNNDGRLNLDELLYIPMDQRPTATPPPTKDNRPSGASAPGAGKQGSGPSAEVRQRQRLFSNFDRNNDGGISLDEYRAGMAGNMAGSRLDRAFKEKDRNGDGKLNLDELMYIPSDQRPWGTPDAKPQNGKSTVRRSNSTSGQ
jgi:Ca2+-binding EF-hand superfamily protein